MHLPSQHEGRPQIPARGPSAGRKGTAAQMAARSGANRLMALSGAVIVAVYAAGYARTEATARQANAELAAATAAGAALGGAGAGGPGQAAAPPAVASAPATPTAQGAPSAGGASSAGAGSAPGQAATGTAHRTAYKDGTYSSIGWGPHGPIQVAVVIRGGRIASAAVTRCGTTYPCQYMGPLEQEVVHTQAAPVDYVSGATASSIAYQQAVSQALAKA